MVKLKLPAGGVAALAGEPLGDGLTSPSSGPARDTTRAALAAEIAVEAAAASALRATSAAVVRARSMVDQASAEVEAATDAVAKAREAQTLRMVHAATNGEEVVAPDRSVREARARELNAADDLVAARAALAACEATAAETQAALDRSPVTAAAAAVAARVLGKMVEEADAMQAELTARRCCLMYLCGEVRGEASKLAADFMARPPFGRFGFENPDAWKSHPAVDRWRETLDKLTRDPDAPLPTG